VFIIFCDLSSGYPLLMREGKSDFSDEKVSEPQMHADCADCADDTVRKSEKSDKSEFRQSKLNR